MNWSRRNDVDRRGLLFYYAPTDVGRGPMNGRKRLEKISASGEADNRFRQKASNVQAQHLICVKMHILVQLRAIVQYCIIVSRTQQRSAAL
jgi:hypothetical protein